MADQSSDPRCSDPVSDLSDWTKLSQRLGLKEGCVRVRGQPHTRELPSVMGEGDVMGQICFGVDQTRRKDSSLLEPAETCGSGDGSRARGGGLG